MIVAFVTKCLMFLMIVVLAWKIEHLDKNVKNLEEKIMQNKG
jgi:hypothetical protein